MKIRTDFVTNSSSSSFVAYGIYDPELADKVEELLKKYESYPKDSIGWISVDNDVISITRDLGDVDWHSTYKIYDELETGKKRSKTQVESDEKKALKTDNVMTIKECTIHSNTKFINSEAFKDCVSLEKVDMPDTVISIGESAFENCKELATVSLSKSLKRIEKSAFRKCSSLQIVEIPQSVEEIKLWAFDGCTSILNINCEAQSKPERWEDGWNALDWRNVHSVNWGYKG